MTKSDNEYSTFADGYDCRDCETLLKQLSTSIAKYDALLAGVAELRVWAKNRISACVGDPSDYRSLIEAGQERRTLEAVLRIINGAETP